MMKGDHRRDYLHDTAHQLARAAHIMRYHALELIHRAGGGHTGGDLSAMEILATLYLHVLMIHPENPRDPSRDRFVMSKGHCVEALYCALAEKDFFRYEQLGRYGQLGTKLAGHPTVPIPGVELCTGALGHGLSVGVGMALAARMDDEEYLTYVLMGDGEQGEGSIYEAAMSAAHYGLDNLIAIIDRNGLQISGSTEEVMALEPLRERWEAFGWSVVEVDGHSTLELLKALIVMRKARGGKPHLLIARTVKGRGVSFMENNPKWHHGVPTDEQLQQALSEVEHHLDVLQ